MSHSDIFNAYAKIAEEQGLITLSEEKESKELKNFKNSDMPRAGSDTIEIIENLYNTKPEKPKDQQYKHNIIEIAHPNKEIIAPSYDKLNGLVENINERQRIMINIVNKPVTGNLTNHKYATELHKSLIQIANDMDNRNQEELSSLADVCLNQLQASIRKQAIVPLLIGGAVAIGVIGGLVYLKTHSDFKNEGFVRNGLRLISELEDIITSGTGTLSMRSEYNDDLKKQLKGIQEQIQDTLSVYGKLSSIIDEIEAPKSAKELQTLVQTVSNTPLYKDAYELFKRKMLNIKPILDKLSKNFQNETYKEKQVKDEGIFSKINDFFGGSLYGGKGLIGDEFDDVRYAIPSFEKSSDEVLDILAGAQEAEKKALEKAQQDQDQVPIDIKSKFETPESNAPSKITPDDQDDMAKMEEELNQLKSLIPGFDDRASVKSSPMQQLQAELHAWHKK